MTKDKIIFIALLLFAGCSRPAKETVAADSLSTSVSKIDSTLLQPEKPDTTASEEEQQSSGPPEYPGSQQKWSYQFYGFSPDLVNTAFETSGHDDYNWLGYEFYVVNVNKNDFAAKPYRERFEDEVPDSVRKMVADWLPKYRLPSKSGFTKYELSAEEGTITIKGNKYKLNLLQTAAGELSIFELRLTDPSKNKTWILQKDRKLPPSRGSVKRYRLKDAYVQENKLAVILEMDMESYEFESYWSYPTKHMMVTGTIDAKPD